MTTNKCTPGTWELIKILKFPFGCMIAAGKTTIVRDHAPHFSSSQKTREDNENGVGFEGAEIAEAKKSIAEHDANFAIMAASKDLGKALVDLLALHDNAANNKPRPTNEDIVDYYARVEKQARDAIKKAGL